MGTLCCAFVVLAIMFPCLGIAKTQQVPSSRKSRKADLAIQKLELEVAKLTEDRGESTKWLFGLLGFLAGLVGAAASVWIARKARLGALDQSVHDKRLEAYPYLVKACSRLAIYFPSNDDSLVVSIGPQDCCEMGQAMSKWYFDDGGLLTKTRGSDLHS